MQPLVSLGPRSCHWPMLELPPGRGDEQMFCGSMKPDDPDQPYCPAHAARAFTGGTTPEGRRWKRLEVIRTAVHRFALRGCVMPRAEHRSTVVVAARSAGYVAPDEHGSTGAPEPLRHSGSVTVEARTIATPASPAQPSDPVGQLSDLSGQLPEGTGADAMRPVAALDLGDAEPQTPPTSEPQLEWMAPADLLIDARYQRDLSEKSLKLIRRIVEGWDWRRFKPPVVAWTERGFEIIDGQHTAIAAATHPTVDRIPVLVVEAAELQDRASAFIGHNRDRLTVAPVQMHHAAVAAGDEQALTIDQVCGRAGVTIMRNVYGSRTYKPGETIAVHAIGALVQRRHAKGAREVLEVLVQGGVAPISANSIKAVEMLMTDLDYADRFEPTDLAKAIAGQTDADGEAKVWSSANSQPLWKGLAVVWFKKTRKRREAA